MPAHDRLDDAASPTTNFRFVKIESMEPRDCRAAFRMPKSSCIHREHRHQRQVLPEERRIPIREDALTAVYVMRSLLLMDAVNASRTERPAPRGFTSIRHVCNEPVDMRIRLQRPVASSDGNM